MTSCPRKVDQGEQEEEETAETKRQSNKGEVNGIMFVDDSIWPTKNAGGMQKAVRLHETFCEFHKIFIHKKKSEYISINANESQVRWNPGHKLHGNSNCPHNNDEITTTTEPKHYLGTKQGKLCQVENSLHNKGETDPINKARQQQKDAMGAVFSQKQGETKGGGRGG